MTHKISAAQRRGATLIGWAVVVLVAVIAVALWALGGTHGSAEPGTAMAADAPAARPAAGAVAIPGGVPGAPQLGSPYQGMWVGQARAITLDPSGQARVDIGSGSGTQSWSGSWKPSGTGVAVTFDRQTAGESAGAGIRPGDVWSGRLVRVSGYEVLEFSATPGEYWCTQAANTAGVCGG
ncbi:hypothetical protein GCM10027169_12330 [Gordonia jinhuaensis]|uniref:Uncharacterized protein n=1 Tax=Gordonia jinhuaensis TaxID=1517702 RepID=A0A916T5X8_9ACTN|nr:hypothetical protein [Gordonia jinhuaensis]GGB31999.1 hypothetical protein GCM10011489_20270 [Gordonia jinhuaensis]